MDPNTPTSFKVCGCYLVCISGSPTYTDPGLTQKPTHVALANLQKKKHMQKPN